MRRPRPHIRGVAAEGRLGLGGHLLLGDVLRELLAELRLARRPVLALLLRLELRVVLDRHVRAVEVEEAEPVVHQRISGRAVAGEKPLRDGRLAVPTGPGIGVVPIPENLRSMAVAVEELTSS